MYIRCAACPGQTWIQSGLLSHSTRITCKCCGMAYPLSDTAHLGRSSQEHYARAQAYSENHDLDLAGAYSVLLGILSLEQALDAHQGGDVKRKARKLVARHGMPEDLARQVVERRKRLHEALREVDSSTDRPGLQHSSTTDVQRMVTAIVGVAVLVGFGWLALRGWDAQVDESVRVAERAEQRHSAAPEVAPPPVPVPVPSTVETAYDDDGRLERISAANPAGVLLAFCDSPELRHRATPLELAAPRGARRDVWFGLFTDDRDVSRLMSIQIQRDRQSRRWIARGTPLEAVPVVPHDLGERRFPVTAPTVPPRNTGWVAVRGGAKGAAG